MFSLVLIRNIWGREVLNGLTLMKFYLVFLTALIMLPLLMNIQLYSNRFLDIAHIFWRNSAGTVNEPCLADSSELVRHSLAFLTFENHYRLAGIKPVGLAGERDNLN